MILAKEELSPHSGHRKRMRDRFLRDGMDSLQDPEVLELLLFYAIARQDTNELAHRLDVYKRQLPHCSEGRKRHERSGCNENHKGDGYYRIALS